MRAMTQVSDAQKRVAALEMENVALRKQAECAAGLAEALRKMLDRFDAPAESMRFMAEAIAAAESALAAYDAAKGGAK